MTEHPALPFHESLFEAEIESDDVSEQASLNNNDNVNISAQDTNPVDMIDELDAFC